MGCVISRQEKEEDVVDMCRERKRLMKLALEKRYTFADAYCKYNQSLYAVSMAIRLFVARHSCPSSPFLITFPSNNEEGALVSNAMYLQQMPSESLRKTVACKESKVALGNSELGEHEKEVKEKEEEESYPSDSDNEEVCGHFYDDVCEEMASPKKDLEWDYFKPFDELRGGFSGDQSFDEDVKAVREKEGIPDLEQDNDIVMQSAESGSGKNKVVAEKDDVSSEVVRADGDVEEKKGLTVIDDGNESGRELLEALKDVADHFLRAYDSGLDIARMLETNRVQFQSGLEAIKESSSKWIKAITWGRTLSRSSSSKSLLTLSSPSSSMREDTKSGTFDDYGMVAGSHSLTLGRLYAWEKKLYQEVKAGDEIRRTYEKKFSLLRKNRCTDKSGAEVSDLHSRISVAIRSAETISDRIQKLRDEELQPQLLELLQGLTSTWKTMLELHRTQSRVMHDVKSFDCAAFEKFSNDSHHLATFQLQVELDNWRSHFAAYVSAQEAYIKALYGWLSQFVSPETDFHYFGDDYSVTRTNGPQLLVICQNWLACAGTLPYTDVTLAMKRFLKDCRVLWNQQEEEQQQKRKVDRLTIELDKKGVAFQRLERRVLESKISGHDSLDGNLRNSIEYLAERKNELEMFRKRLDDEKEKHLKSVQDTRQITIDAFRIGLSSVFESLAEFSKASVNMYSHLVTYSANERK